jgi:hypothetical protein
MTDDNTAKATSSERKTTPQKARSSRSTKAVATESATTGEQTVEMNNTEVTDKNAMSTDDKVVQIATRPAQADSTEQSAIALHQQNHIAADGPLMSSEFEVAETISSAGVRPIAASHLELAGSFMNGRPIAASSLTVYEMLPGDRPVFNSEVKMVDGTLLMNRPIMVSSPDLMQGSLLPGGRPIASNQTVDPEPEILMGYLD